jgi:transcriptional regulator with XRE-family HTH domain
MNMRTEPRGLKYKKASPVLRIDWQGFGKDLQRERERRGLSFRQFEELTGVNYTTLCRIERLHQPCGSEVFMTLAAAIGKDPKSYTTKRAERFAEWIKQPLV